MFRKIFSLEIGGEQITFGYGNPGGNNHAIYDPDMKRVVMRKSSVTTPRKLKKVVRHEAVHVAMFQAEEFLAERIETAMDRADDALDAYLEESPT